MNRRAWLTAGVGGVAAAAGAGWAWWQLGRETGLTPTEQAFWNTSFEQPAGSHLATQALQGKPLLLNFWATWCPPCVKEMPLLDAFYREQAGKGWQVLGLAVDSPTPVREFLAKRPVGFPIGLAGMNGVALSRSLGNDQGGMPFTVVFDRGGTAIARKVGAVLPEELSQWVGQLR